MIKSGIHREKKSEAERMLYSKEIPVRHKVDVFVAGGGAAGVAAAVAAARGGARVFLAEKTGCFGGLGTAGLVPAFAPFHDGVRTVAAGIGLEIRNAVAADVPVETYWTMIRAEELKLAYDKLVAAAGVEFSFFTDVVDVIAEEGKIQSVILHAKSGFFAVEAKVFIDCTGDADLVAMAGGAFEKGDEEGNVMPATLCSLWAGGEPERRTVGDSWMIEKAFADGVLSVEDRHLPGIFPHADGMCGGNIGHVFDLDPLDEGSLTRGMVYGRQSLVEYAEYYHRYIPGYENIQLYTTASLLGVRESRRAVCDYMLSVEDFIRRAVFPDEIGRYCYPVDIHVKNTEKEEYERFQKEYHETLRYKDGESYGIPYRSLIPVSFQNMLIAGRCAGTDRKMQASLRVMPGCFLTGQAAGAAAALAAPLDGAVREVPFDRLKAALLALGAYLPN